MSPTTTCKARFFHGFGVEELPVILDEDGTVLVWDRVASHYTRVHALSARTCRRIRAEILAHLSWLDRDTARVVGGVQ